MTRSMVWQRTQDSNMRFCPGNALEPFCVRELSLEILGRVEAEINRGHPRHPNPRRYRGLQIITHGTGGECMPPRF